MLEKGVIKILFICHGNICRSTMAESVMTYLVDKEGLVDKFYINSAATSREEIVHHMSYNETSLTCIIKIIKEIFTGYIPVGVSFFYCKKTGRRTAMRSTRYLPRCIYGFLCYRQLQQAWLQQFLSRLM